MLFLAIFATIAAVLWAFFVMFANGMRSSPGPFVGNGVIAIGFAIAAVLWGAWWFG